MILKRIYMDSPDFCTSKTFSAIYERRTLKDPEDPKRDRFLGGPKLSNCQPQKGEIFWRTQIVKLSTIFENSFKIRQICSSGRY